MVLQDVAVRHACCRRDPVRKLLLAALTFVLLILAVPYAGPLSSGALLLTLPSVLAFAPQEHDLPDSYEPRHKGYIHLGTGSYIRDDEDLLVRGTPPLVLRRTSRSGFREAKEFGIGTTHAGERYLAGDPDRFQWLVLILPSGTWVRFERTSSGTAYYNAMFEHHSSPSEYYGARVGWTGAGWTLRMTDGTVMTFQGCGAGSFRLCSIVSERDADGHTINYRRDSTGRLLRIEAAFDRWIAFDYDERNRISRAFDPAGHSVRYEYDTRGRLSRVISSEGREHRYQYTDLDELATIVDPATRIENSFGSDGRVIRQINHAPGEEPYTFNFGYIVRNGEVAQAETNRSDGTWTRYTYGAHRYIDSESWGRVGFQPATFVYERDAVSRVITALSVTCPDRNGRPLRHSSDVPAGYEEWIKWDLLQTNCSWNGKRWREVQ